VAANGIVGINYDTEQPDKDLEALIRFLKDNAKELKIHPKKIGILSCSGNVPTAMSYLFQKRRTDIRFGIFYYGISFTPDNKYRDEFNKMLGSLGGYSEELEDVTYIQPGFPILLVKAGKDVFPNINESIDHFRDFAESSETKVTFIEYEDGVHGFDAYQHTEESAEIIVKTLEFMKTNFEK
jgi:acetyl esterase/lipase